MDSLRAFCLFLISSEVIQHDPTLGLRLPLKKAKGPKGLDDAQSVGFEATMKYGEPKAREKERAAEALDGMAAA